MDDAWKWYISSFLLTVAMLGTLASAVDLEYITPEKSAALADQFSAAKLTDSDQKSLSSGKSHWSCDMYGMRTHLQVQHGLKLYDFSKPATDGAVKNSGAGPVEVYRRDKDAMVGHTEKVMDRVRMTSGGQLISQLSLNTPSAGTVIAYSLCKPL